MLLSGVKAAPNGLVPTRMAAVTVLLATEITETLLFPAFSTVSRQNGEILWYLSSLEVHHRPYRSHFVDDSEGSLITLCAKIPSRYPSRRRA
jgi:hypothetical protein